MRHETPPPAWHRDIGKHEAAPAHPRWYSKGLRQTRRGLTQGTALLLGCGSRPHATRGCCRSADPNVPPALRRGLEPTSDRQNPRGNEALGSRICAGNRRGNVWCWCSAHRSRTQSTSGGCGGLAPTAGTGKAAPISWPLVSSAQRALALVEGHPVMATATDTRTHLCRVPSGGGVRHRLPRRRPRP